MKELYTVKEMTTWLSEYLVSEGFETKIYSDIFLPARVPVYARKRLENEELIEELVVDVINSASTRDFFYTLHVLRTLTDEGQEMEIMDASSASFFRYYFPRAKVYWAYPDYLKKDEGYEKFKVLCKKYNIGLFELIKGEGDNGIVKEIELPAVSLMDTLFEKFKTAISPIMKRISKNQNGEAIIEDAESRIYKELDRHIEETNRYLIYYPEPEYKRREISGRVEGRNISLTLIDKLSEIRKLSYKRQLHEFGSKYRIRIEDDYDIALDLIKKLWQLQGLEYPEFQKDFEPVLLLNPRYRDHFLHQLHVFLLGCYIIDGIYEDESIAKFKKINRNRIEDIWLLASTYHDFNYNIQNYNEWIATFFRNSLFLDSNPSYLKLDQCYVKEGYMFKTKELCDAFELKKIDRTILLFFYEKIINKKNHGMLGALSLLKLFDQKLTQTTKIKKKGIIQAARAIALHDEDIWRRFCGREDGLNPQDSESDDLERKFSQMSVLKNLRFKDDPMSFLLIFCDTIQEWGRVGRDYEETGARLDDVGVSDSLVWVNISVSDENAFNGKKNEIDRVKGFLLDKRFKIRLSSREGLGSNMVERHMEGKS